MIVFFSLVLMAVLGFFLSSVLRMDAGTAVKLVAGLPLVFLLSLDLPLLWFPGPFRVEDNPPGEPSFWKPRPGGWTLNPAHPAAKHLFRFWMALGVVWLGAVDEAFRHDFSHIVHGLFG